MNTGLNVEEESRVRWDIVNAVALEKSVRTTLTLGSSCEILMMQRDLYGALMRILVRDLTDSRCQHLDQYDRDKVRSIRLSVLEPDFSELLTYFVYWCEASSTDDAWWKEVVKTQRNSPAFHRLPILPEDKTSR